MQISWNCEVKERHDALTGEERVFYYRFRRHFGGACDGRNGISQAWLEYMAELLSPGNGQHYWQLCWSCQGLLLNVNRIHNCETELSAIEGFLGTIGDSV